MDKQTSNSGEPSSNKNMNAERKLDLFYRRHSKPKGDSNETDSQRESIHILDLGQGLTPRAPHQRPEFSFPLEMATPSKKTRDLGFLTLVTGVGLFAIAVLVFFYYPAWKAARKVPSTSAPTSHPESLLSPRVQTRLLDEVANTLRKEGVSAEELARAENTLQSILRSDPHNARAHKLLGDWASRQNRDEAAIPSYQKALKAQPTYLEALVPLALIYDKLNNIPEAIAYYERISQIRPADSSIHLRLASLYGAEDRKEEAIKQYRGALALSLDNKTRAKVNDEITRLNRIIRDEKKKDAEVVSPKTTPTKGIAPTTVAKTEPAPSQRPDPPVSSKSKPLVPLMARGNLAFPPPVLHEVIPVQEGSIGREANQGEEREPPLASSAGNSRSPSQTPKSEAVASHLVAPQKLAAITSLPKPLQEGDELSAELADKKPVLRSRIEPRMPSAARNFAGTASVFMAIKISETGQVIETRIIRKPENDLGFSQAAEAAVRKWRYEPAMKNGVRVKVWTTCQIYFKQTG